MNAEIEVSKLIEYQITSILMDLGGLVTTVFLCLRLFEITEWGWIQVLAPLLLTAVATQLVGVVFMIVRWFR